MAKRRTRKALDAPESLEGVLERAGENRFAKKKLPIPLADWRAAVGPRIADRARPTALERGVLVVRVATSVWANELQMLAPELVLRLKQRGIAVDGLRFRVGPLDPVDRPPERRAYRKVPSPAPLVPEIRDVVAQIADDDLRDAIEEAARANLAWQEFVGPAHTLNTTPNEHDPRGNNVATPERVSGGGSKTGGFRGGPKPTRAG